MGDTEHDATQSPLSADPLDRGRRRLVVFSHPNHELAVFGLIQRLRPHILYLTDGGGGARLAETQRGLELIGAYDRARFLNHPESAYYAALIRRDGAFYAAIGAQICDAVDSLRAEQVFCDGVEFYNPVHDMSLPLVLHALRDMSGVSVYTLPLVYQRPSEAEAYEVQRLPGCEQQGQILLRLTDRELSAKLHARDAIYHELRHQLGAVLDVSASHAALEVVQPCARLLPHPDAGRVLRYEWRGRLLRERGEVDEVITYAGHYLAVVSQLGMS
jgi:hypothetical protein